LAEQQYSRSLLVLLLLLLLLQPLPLLLLLPLLPPAAVLPLLLLPLPAVSPVQLLLLLLLLQPPLLPHKAYLLLERRLLLRAWLLWPQFTTLQPLALLPACGRPALPARPASPGLLHQSCQEGALDDATAALHAHR
jgi:hypothetical protein